MCNVPEEDRETFETLKEALLRALGISRMAAFQQNLKTFLMVNICEKHVVRSVMEFAKFV